MLRRAYAEKPYEFILTVLVVVSAGMAALTGYLSALNGEAEADFRGEGLGALTKASTNALEANQIILRDERILITADFADTIGETEFAQELRNRTRVVRLGYLDFNGNGTPEYDGDYDTAVNAYLEDMFAPQQENQTRSDIAFANAEIVSAKEVDFLLGTILFALAAVLAGQGLAADSQRVRRLFTYIVVGFLSIPIGLTVFTAFG
ncbi:MAG: hypothetical protein ACE5I4_00260 [Thermoplasmata archaeon]